MIQIPASLPILGHVDITFYKESAELWNFFGTAERARLDGIAHLGTAARAFTGLNHSRLEYTLLQCALIQYVGVVYRADPYLAVANRVSSDGLRNPVSSGEELLKAWAIIGNIGHAQWTYGVERGLMVVAATNDAVRRWLVDSTRIPDLRRWIGNTIEAFADTDMHYVLAARRIAYGEPYDRRKTRFLHLLRNLVLPINDLLPGQPSDRQKLSRLRRLFRRIRLVSLVSLDAYYSHSPIRVSLQTTINSLRNLASLTPESRQAEQMLEQVAAWLGDELYLHPSAIAVLREYEMRVEREFPPLFRKARRSKRGLGHVLGNVMGQGFGNPWVGRFTPLLRLTFDPPHRHLLGPGSLFVAGRSLRSHLVNSPKTELSLTRNPFSDRLHLDLLYQERSAESSDVAQTICKAVRWLLRALEAEVIASWRRVFPRSRRDRLNAVAKNVYRRRLAEEQVRFEDLLLSVVRYLLPDGWRLSITPVLPSESLRGAVRCRVVDDAGEVDLDSLTPLIEQQLNENPRELSEDRLQEFRGLQWLLDHTQATVFVAACEPIHVYDPHGKRRDEWDACALEVRDGQLRLRIFESKSGSGRGRRADAAFNQLDETRRIICSREGVRYRRRRVRDIGACLTLRF